jgi:anti-anti-sigma factor
MPGLDGVPYDLAAAMTAVAPGGARLERGMADGEEQLSAELLRLVVVRDRAGATVLVVGHLDMAGGGRLRDRVEDVLATRPGSIAIDASGVTFVDSSGLAALLSARHAVLTEAGVAFRVVDPSPALQAIAEMTGFEKLLSDE